MIPHAEVEKVFPLVSPENVVVQYARDPNLEGVVKSLDGAITRVKEELGIPLDMRKPDMTPEQKRDLSHNLKDDGEWLRGLNYVLQSYAPGVLENASLEMTLGALTSPDWNVPVLMYSGDKLKDGKLIIKAKPSHSFVTLWSYHPELEKCLPKHLRPMASNVATITNDPSLEVGLRAVHMAFPLTRNNTPARQIFYGMEPDGFSAEMAKARVEELGLKGEFKEGVISRIVLHQGGKHIVYGGILYANCSSEELREIWGTAPDKGQHTRLHSLQMSRNGLLEPMKVMQFDPDKMDPYNPHITSKDNKGKFLPGCIATNVSAGIYKGVLTSKDVNEAFGGTILVNPAGVKL
ncbi:hypothetical protein ACFL1B_01680 [Nanoarchaeota archaeon]